MSRGRSRSKLRRWLAIPEGQGLRATRLVALIFSFSSALALLKAAQSGIFLEAYPRSAIPWAFAASALVLALASSLCVSLSPRIGPARLAAMSLAFGALATLVLRLSLALSDAAPLRFALYVVVEALSGVLLIQVWSAAANATDARSARRLLPVAGIGGSLAWIAGGLLVAPLAAALGAEGLLLIAPLWLLLALWVLRLITLHDLDDGSRRGRRRASLIHAWAEGMRFVRREPLMRLAASLAILALLSEQFMDLLLMAEARATLVDADAISTFFGRYYAITSLLGLVLLSGMSARLLSGLGATRSLLVAPVALGMASLVALLVPGLAAAVALRGTGRVLKQSIWCSAAEQIQTPLSGLRRSQAKAAIRGVLAPAVYALSAIALGLLPGEADPRWLALLTAFTSATMVLIVVLRARPVYRAALLGAVDERRILLGPGRTPSAAELDADACAALGGELVQDDAERASLAAEVLAMSDAPIAARTLATGLAHRSVAVRHAAARGLSRLDPEGNAPLLADALRRDPSVEVRRICVRALRDLAKRVRAPDLRSGRVSSSHMSGASVSRSLLQGALAAARADEDPEVAVHAKVALLESDHEGEALGTALLPLLRLEASFAIAAEALSPEAVRAPGARSQLAAWLERGPPELRLVAAETVLRLRLLQLLPDVVGLLREPLTAHGAARLLVALDAELDDAPDAGADTMDASVSRLARGLAERSSAPRQEVLVLRLLQHPDAAIRHHATQALGAAIRAGKRSPLGREVVEPLLRDDVRRAFRLYSILAGLAHDDGVPDWEVEATFAPLAHEVDLRIEATRGRLLALLVLMGREQLVGAVEVGQRRRSAARDAQMAELLELGLEGDLGRSVVPLFERLTLRERVEAGTRLGHVDRAALSDPLDAIVSLGDAHLRRVALLVYGARLEARFGEVAAQDVAMVPIYERICFLRSVPLFRELEGDDVLQLAEKVEQVTHPAGSVVFSQGDPGDELYLVVRGRVAMMQGDITLAEMSPPDFFGELALLDHAPRSADALCLGDCELLRLRGADLEELLARRPSASREIVRVLARRLRDAARLSHVGSE